MRHSPSRRLKAGKTPAPRPAGPEVVSFEPASPQPPPIVFPDPKSFPVFGMPLVSFSPLLSGFEIHIPQFTKPRYIGANFEDRILVLSAGSVFR
jgi:hypothetical protein